MDAIGRALEILELDVDATPERIRRAHRRLAKAWHPDRFQDDPMLRRQAEERTKAINWARDRLRSFEGPRPRPRDPSPSARPDAGVPAWVLILLLLFAGRLVGALLHRTETIPDRSIASRPAPITGQEPERPVHDWNVRPASPK